MYGTNNNMCLLGMEDDYIQCKIIFLLLLFLLLLLLLLLLLFNLQEYNKYQ